MPGILKISLFLILLVSSISTGFAASSENFSVNVEEIIPISQMVDPYFDKLVASSGTNLKEQPVIGGSWSPDGSRLVVGESINPQRGVTLHATYILNADGSGIRELASTPNNTKGKSLNLYYMQDITWSPDGNRVVISANVFDVRDFYVLADPDKTLIKTAGKCNYTTVDEIRVNILNIEWQNNFMWNLEGTKALILMDRKPLRSQLYLLDPNGFVLQQLTDAPKNIEFAFVGTALWSHDSKEIAYSVTGQHESDNGLWITNENGTETKRVNDDGVLVAWSPKGNKIAFAQGDNLHTINPDGGEKNLIASTITDYEWHPSGDYISFVSSGSVFVASPNGSTKMKLAEDGRFLEGWSPDGSRLLVSQDGFTGLFIIKLAGYEDPLSIDLPTSANGENCELRVHCMSEPVANALLTLNKKEIGFTNSSGLLNYSCPDAGRYVINASKKGYRSASKVLIVQENSSASPVRAAVSEPSSDSEKETVTGSKTQTPGFRGITVILFIALFILRRSSL